MAGQHVPELEAPGGWPGRPEAREGGAVVGGEHRVAVCVRHSLYECLVHHVRRHFRVEDEVDESAVGCGLKGSHWDCGSAARREGEVRRGRHPHVLVEGEAHRLGPHGLSTHETGRCPVLHGEGVRLVEEVLAAGRGGDDAHGDGGLAGQWHRRVEHHTQGVRRLCHLRQGPGEGGLHLDAGPTLESQEAVHPDARGRPGNAVHADVHHLQRQRGVNGDVRRSWARSTVEEEGAACLGEEGDGVDVEGGQLNRGHSNTSRGDDLQADAHRVDARELRDVGGHVSDEALAARAPEVAGVFHPAHDEGGFPREAWRGPCRNTEAQGAADERQACDVHWLRHLGEVARGQLESAPRLLVSEDEEVLARGGRGPLGPNAPLAQAETAGEGGEGHDFTPAGRARASRSRPGG
ncbi:hypothetical protein STIAU_1388 [Stigmatella aurantiaca DW4/3-1]|uniref:Uncharacterized protein n=1 Tax=Stigmatella aurantiaca (strain DW4/3-1) TaxID=378806 RepID=Q08W02_STIAD|nr:hypothetical protein STIAU_1388 [Stigmatella aurantiaca DW4/3-1]